jgi:hypothetical protein
MLEGEGRKRWHTRALGVFKGKSSSMRLFWGPIPWSFFSSLGLFFVARFFFFFVAVLNGTCSFQYHRHVHRIGWNG